MAKREGVYITIGYYLAYVAVGLATAVLGPTLPGLAAQTQTQLTTISLLFTSLSLGYLIGSLQGGRLYDRVPGHPVMAMGLLIMAAMLAVVPFMSRLWLLGLAVLTLGITSGAVDVGGNTLLVWVYGRQVGPFMNGLHFCFGLGSFLSPIIVAQALRVGGDITWAYWALSLLILPGALWLFRLASPKAQVDSIDEAMVQRSPKRYRPTRSGRGLLVLIVLFFFLYVGAEAGFGGWIFTYAVALKLGSETTAAYLTSAFWGALTLGRLLGIPLAARIRPRWILLADLVGCLISLGVLLLWSDSLAATWIGTLGLGFSMASIFPTVISLAERRMKITGQITGWFLAGSSIGGMFLPWLIGQLFDTVGPTSTVVVIALDLLVAFGVFAVLIRYSGRRLSLLGRLLYNGSGRSGQ
jgi:FHS family Na+ dependent glucose MFS transporter 1